VLFFTPLIQRILIELMKLYFEGQSLLAVPGLGGEIDSTRSSLSEVSAISNASTKTYLDEASTLVLESTENGIKKYFLIQILDEIVFLDFIY
jgi:hypothetical protein